MRTFEDATLDEVVARSKQEPTIAEALTVACVWEAERAISQAKRNEYREWETCFRVVIERVLAEYYDDGVPDLTHYRADKNLREKLSEVTGLLHELLGDKP